MIHQKIGSIFLLCCFILLLGSVGATAQEKTLTIWSHWGQEPVKVRFMNAVADAFKKEHGIAVNIVWMPKNRAARQVAVCP